MWLKATEVDLTQLHRIPSNQYRYVQSMNIAYKDIPGEHVLFCVPPWPSSSTCYIPLALALDKHVRLIALDLPGWAGFSDKPRFKPNLENYASLVSDFINSFKLEHYSVLGYSFGGAILQRALASEKIKPQKKIFVSSLHNGYRLAQQNSKSLKLYKWVQAMHFPDEVIKKVARAYLAMTRKRSAVDSADALENSQLFAQLDKEAVRVDVDSAFGALLSLIDNEQLSTHLNPKESIVVYADSDPDYIKHESKELATFLDVEPIYLEKADHDHLVFDVNKSADVILNFLLA